MALTKYNYNSFDVTPVASSTLAFNAGANGLTTMAASSMILIKTLTASSDDTLDFVNGTDDVVLDNTYPVYKFVWTNIHPGTDDKNFQVNFRDGGSSYDATKTSTSFGADHNEADTTAQIEYKAGNDVAQGTGIQALGASTGADNDQSTSGELWLFNPSSTTFVKHWMSRSSQARHSDAAQDFYTAGYCNVTAAIDGVQFTFQSGNIDSGSIKLYGIKDS